MTCKDCQHWQRNTNPNEPGVPLPYGHCKEKSPIVVVWVMRRPTGNTEAQFGWPVTYEDEVACGAFKSGKEEE